MATTSTISHERVSPPKSGRIHPRAWLPYLAKHRAEALTLAMVAAVFTIDLWLSLGVASAVPYTFAVLVALKARRRSFTLQIAILCCVLTIAKMFLSPDRGSTELWKVYANRGLAVFSISLTAFLGMQRQRSEEERQLVEEEARLHLADLAHMGRLKTAGQLATGLAHELNQPLTAISLHAEVAMRLGIHREATTQEGLLDALKEITEQSQRAAAIMRTLRALVQKSQPKRSPVNLNDIVHEIVRLIDSQARRVGVALHLQLASGLPPVLGDRIQLGQVLFNLLQNAIDASAETSAGAVQIQTRVEPGDGVTIHVSDSGVGLAAGDVERVFERFYTTKATGMGMGLAISRSIVEAHGGKLWAEPNLPCGAIFTVSLPLLSSAMP